MTDELSGTIHHELVYKRRIKALADMIAPMLNPGLVLDVGCGNGMLAALLMRLRSDIRVIGLDVYLRPVTAIEVILYDGHTIPLSNDSLDSVLIVDTLHHTNDAVGVLTECLRVTRGSVVVKDHFSENPIEHTLLRVLDWGGNAAHGVSIPYNYVNRARWTRMLESVGAVEQCRYERIPKMYPQPLQTLIGQRIQYVAQLVAAR